MTKKETTLIEPISTVFAFDLTRDAVKPNEVACSYKCCYQTAPIPSPITGVLNEQETFSPIFLEGMKKAV